jgi:hypothetical protein
MTTRDIHQDNTEPKPVFEARTLILLWLATAAAAALLLLATFQMRELAQEVAAAQVVVQPTSEARATVVAGIPGQEYVPQVGDTVYLKGPPLAHILHWGPDPEGSGAFLLPAALRVSVEAVHTDDNGDPWVQLIAPMEERRAWLQAEFISPQPPSPSFLPPQSLDQYEVGLPVVLLSDEANISILIEPDPASLAQAEVDAGTMGRIEELGPEQDGLLWLHVVIDGVGQGWVTSEQARLMTLP